MVMMRSVSLSGKTNVCKCLEATKQALAVKIIAVSKIASNTLFHLFPTADMFYSLLNYSKTSFDDMFRETYGMIYLQNARVFDDLFTSLESYYRTGRPDIGYQMDLFFKKFYQRMFVVYNSQCTFDEQ